MKKLLTYFKNLDNDQKAILKSTSIITAIVLIASALIGSYMGILAIPLHIIVTGVFSNKITRTKKYIFDKRSNKKFKLATTKRFVYAWMFLAITAFALAHSLKEDSIAIPFVLLVSTIVINAIAFKLKLPLSAISLGSLPKSSNVNMQLDSTISSSNIWHEEQSNRQLNTPAYSSLTNNMYHDQYHKK